MSRALRVVFIFAAVFLLIFILFGRGGPDIEPGSVLVFDLQGEYVEAVEAPLVARALGQAHVPLTRVTSELRKAARDDRLSTVVLRIRSMKIGWGKAQEIREAITALREAGRRPIAYLEVEPIGANIEYYIASAAEEIYLAPGSRVPFVGLAAQYLFLGGMWENLGIDLEVERVGDYKTAADFLAGKKMTAANREMANWLLDSIEGQFISGVAAGRTLSEPDVRRAIADAPSSAEALKERGLIDGVGFLDEVIDRVAKDAPQVTGEKYALVQPGEVGFEPVARVALIYGSGNVVTGDAESTRTGDPILASETLSSAIMAAAEDDSIDAIVFRIDSPGGSALASDIIWRATQRAKAKKPFVVSFSDVAASGGYYVACGADHIVAEPGSITGSIGVLMVRPVFERLLEKIDVGSEVLLRGDHADLFVTSRPLSQSSRQLLSREVNGVYDQFVARVAEGRSMDPAAVDAIGRGRVWTGAQAAELGLVDSLGGLPAAVAELRTRLELAEDADVALVPYPPPKTLSASLSKMLQRSALRASALPLPGPLGELVAWLSAVPTNGPVLLPPLVVEIR